MHVGAGLVPHWVILDTEEMLHRGGKHCGTSGNTSRTGDEQISVSGAEEVNDEIGYIPCLTRRKQEKIIGRFIDVIKDAMAELAEIGRHVISVFGGVDEQKPR